MKADLKELIRVTADQSEYVLYFDNDGYEHNNWICLIDYSIIQTKQLIEDFGFSDVNDIANAGIYIPLLIVDIVQIEKDYIREHYCNYEKTLLKLSDGTDKSYQVLFNEFLEINMYSYDSWIGYRDEQVKKMVISWCLDNSMPFK